MSQNWSELLHRAFLAGLLHIRASVMKVKRRPLILHHHWRFRTCFRYMLCRFPK
jgi:hypothetical protein